MLDREDSESNGDEPQLPVVFCNGEAGVCSTTAAKFEPPADETTTSQLLEDFKRLAVREERKTGFVYDSYMTRHKILSARDHVESPQRISRIYDQLREDGLIKFCTKIPSRFATIDELNLVHERNYVQLLIDTSKCSANDMITFERQFNSIYFCGDSYKSASLAVGCLLELVDAILTEQIKNGFAVIRPPGHHAEEDFACGFCFFNNVAIAAKYAQEKYGLSRILILDWDVHHGNGTQNAFYGQKEVLYISLHRYDNGYFFPVKGDGHWRFSGDGPGRGFNVNVPWNGRKMGDPEYIAAFEEIIMPIATSYNPELVIISAGFDAALGDPLGGYRVSPGGYAKMTSLLSTLAGGKLILALEGGYNLTSISLSFSACVSVLVNKKDQLPSVEEGLLNRSAFQAINDVVKYFKDFWPSLGPEKESEKDVYEFKEK